MTKPRDPVVSTVRTRELSNQMKLSYLIFLMLGMLVFLAFLSIHTGYFNINSANMPLLFRVSMPLVKVEDNSTNESIMLDVLHSHHQRQNASYEQASNSSALRPSKPLPSQSDTDTDSSIEHTSEKLQPSVTPHTALEGKQKIHLESDSLVERIRQSSHASSDASVLQNWKSNNFQRERTSSDQHVLPPPQMDRSHSLAERTQEPKSSHQKAETLSTAGHDSSPVNPKHAPVSHSSTPQTPVELPSENDKQTEATDIQKSKPAAEADKQQESKETISPNKKDSEIIDSKKSKPLSIQQPEQKNVSSSLRTTESNPSVPNILKQKNAETSSSSSPDQRQIKQDPLSDLNALKIFLSQLTNKQHSAKPSTEGKAENTTESARENENYTVMFEESWQRSAVWNKTDEYVGDSPLFPPCSTTNFTWSAYNFVEPFPYLKTSKNPCWFEGPRRTRELSCIPYFYLAGVAKGGTSDLARRIRMHPDVFRGTQKEYHWWERLRYGFFDEDDPEEPVDMEGGTPFKNYIRQVTGDEIYDLQEELENKGSSVRIFGDFSPSYLWDPQNWYVLEGNQGCQEPRVVVGQHIHHVFPQAKILLTFRHPTPRLYSRFVSRIPRSPDLRGSTPEDFHNYVVDGIEKYKACFREWSIRHCAYNVSVYKDSVVRLVEGMYPVFMADWLRVWPKEQMFIMRYEDYGGHERERVSEVYDFLGLSQLEQEDMDEVVAHQVVNSGSEEYHRYGLMLDKTRQLLDDFYQPFIAKFAHMLQDDRFLWKDTDH